MWHLKKVNYTPNKMQIITGKKVWNLTLDENVVLKPFLKSLPTQELQPEKIILDDNDSKSISLKHNKIS